MYCKRCKVTVKGTVNRCPLCGQSLVQSPNSDETDEFVVGSRKPHVNGTLLYKRIYSFVSLVLLITSVLLNVFLFKEHTWSILVAAGLLYVYLLINRLFITYYNIAYVTVTMATGATAIAFMVQWIFHLDQIAVYYVVPIISMVSTMVLGIVGLLKPQRARQYLLDYLVVGLFGISPWLISMIIYRTAGLPSKISACVGAVMLICLLCFSLRDVARDLDKYFHS